MRGIGKLDLDKKRLIALYRYKTDVEEMQSHAREVEDSNKKKQAAWAADAEKNARRIAAMPQAFKERVEFFMRRPDWGWQFGPYELFVCEEAARFAKAMREEKQLIAFAKLPWDDQKRLDPNLSQEHSGNTFGAAVMLARLFVTQPELVPKMHGALCPLVGCQDYGCYSTTEEAKKE